MKKFVTTLFLMFAAVLTLTAQNITTNQPLNKNAVLEEYTGIHCQYCPQGHAISAAILAANPGRAAVIAIHQGSFASPSAGEPDYRTPFGDALAGQTGLTGYPAGTVNRHIFSGTKTALGRGDWTASCNWIMQQPSPVNIGVTSSIDTNTRQLTVQVELYYTGNSATTTNYINVALIQNHIFGPQTGGNAGNNYEHMEMLRYLVTGQWGDAVSPTTQGSLIQKTYNYTIPASYNSVPCVLANCEIVAFVTESQQEILTGDVVEAINGTNLYIGDITTADSFMKLGQPTVVTDFNLEANSNIAGTHQFKLKLAQAMPADWAVTFEINGQNYSDSALVDMTKGTPTPVILHVTPGTTPGFPDFRFELTSMENLNAPKKYFTAYVLSNVNTLLVNAGGDDNATSFQQVYIDGLTAAGCDHLAVMKSDLFEQANAEGILTDVISIFYNCAWTFPAFTDPEAIAVKSFVDGGGHLFVAGQDIGWDIMSGADGSHGTVDTKDLYTNYLKAQWIDDGGTANNKLVANTADVIFGTVATSNVVDVNGGNMYPDQIGPLQDAMSIFYYNTTASKISAIRSMKDQAKVVYFGIGMEMVQTAAVKDDILKRSYDWFMEGVGIEKKEIGKTARLGQNYPNPADGLTTITLSGINNNMTLDVTDLTGRTILTVPVKAGSNRVQIETSKVQSGLYIYRLIDNGRTLDSKRMQVCR